MNKSTIEAGQPEQQNNSEQKDQDKQVSPSIANANVVGSLVFTKVFDTGNKRFYKLSAPVSKAPNPMYEWEKEREYNIGRLKEQYKKYHTDLIEFVAVSDAHTHIERLLFAAIPINDEKTEYGCLSGLHLDGKHTMMIHGGSSDAVYPDEVYLRRLSKANGYAFGGCR